MTRAPFFGGFMTGMRFLGALRLLAAVRRAYPDIKSRRVACRTKKSNNKVEKNSQTKQSNKTVEQNSRGLSNKTVEQNNILQHYVHSLTISDIMQQYVHRLYIHLLRRTVGMCVKAHLKNSESISEGSEFF